MSENRQAFEMFISSPPFEKDIERFPTDGAKYPWPGAYRDITVELAWECWKEATSVQIARFESQLAEAEAKIPRWIPVSEGLPPPIGRWPSVYGSEWVIASYRWNGAVFIGECRFVHGKKQAWKTSNDDYDIEVTHWMPLPEAPKSGKGE